MVKLSIIIPTLNEEKCLPKLLESIKSQNFKDYEIIVADGNSKDKTRQIAKKFGCKIVAGIGHPSKGRNNGAKAAKGEYLLFLDADVLLGKNFIESSLAEFAGLNLDAAAVYAIPISSSLSDIVLVSLFNFSMKVMQHISPVAGAYAMLAKKSAHKKIRGFDETLTILDDTDYAQRVARIGKFGVLKKPRVLISMRRLEKFGRLATTKTFLIHYINRGLGRKITKEAEKTKNIGYKFDYER